MKVERKKPESVFKPVIVTLESQEEVNKLFALLDHAQINKKLALCDMDAELEEFATNGYIIYNELLNEIIED